MFGRRFGHHFHGGDWEAFPWQQRGPGRGPWSGPWGGPGRGPWGGPRGPWGGPGGPGFGWQFSPEQQALRSTAAEVARLFMIASRSSADNPERQAQLRAFLERSRKELSDMIYSSSGQSSSAPTGSSDPNVEQA